MVSKEEWWQQLHEAIIGPECPSCARNDGSHALGCDVEDYIAQWKNLKRERAKKLADEFGEIE